jgi:hypothetical protein
LIIDHWSLILYSRCEDNDRNHNHPRVSRSFCRWPSRAVASSESFTCNIALRPPVVCSGEWNGLGVAVPHSAFRIPHSAFRIPHSDAARCNGRLSLSLV